MLLFVVAACMIPLLIQGRLIAQSSRQMQVERRIIDVQNQCQILSNKMSRNGYLGNSGVDTSGTDTELSMLADIFNGRILIVNSGFRIVKDTFSLAEGKICISDETLRCFQGETTSRYDTEKHYFILAVPIADTVQTADARKSPKTAGVMLVTVSTESMFNMEEALLDKASLYQLTVFILSMMPIIELRGGLVAAKMLGVDLLPAMLICFIGTILPTPFILLFINKIFDWMRNTRFVKLVDRMEAKGRSKFAQIEKYKTFGLLIFVAIPLPGTGAWTGSLAAALMKMPIKDALFSVIGGTLIADILMAIFSYGLLGMFI